jgi:hypothetical protein
MLGEIQGLPDEMIGVTMVARILFKDFLQNFVKIDFLHIRELLSKLHWAANARHGIL